jgi:HlyD family secretion protein
MGQTGRGLGQGGENRQEMMGQTGADKRQMAENIKILWIKNDDAIRPARVITGVTDGTNIEIISGLNEGDEVVTAMKLSSKKKTEKTKKETQKSPFIPQRPDRGQGQGPGRRM